MIFYLPPWAVYKYAAVNRVTGKIEGYKIVERNIMIDPRGHFLGLRCATIITFTKIIGVCRRLEKPFLEFAEFFANYPTW